MEVFFQVLLQSVSNASVYILLGAGVTIVFGVMRVLNFAQGELMTIPAYVGMMAVAMIPFGAPWAPIVALLVVLPFSAVLGLLFYSGILKPLRKHDPFMIVVATFGCALFLQGVVYSIWGGSPRGIERSMGAWRVGGVAITHSAAINLGLALLTLILLGLVLTRSTIGREMRAVAQSREGAELAGVGTERAGAIAMMLAAILAGVAGVIILQRTLLTPFVGFEVVLKAFAISIVAGLGQVSGLVAAGLLLGLAETLVGTYISGALSEAAIFGVVIVVLMLRPSGIAGLRVRS